MIRCLLVLYCLIAANTLLSQIPQTVKAIDSDWQFKELNEQYWLPAKVPGTIHTDLMDNGIISDPYYRLNERKVQWIDKKDWIYQTIFNLDKQSFNRQNHELNFEGLDTYATVYLNDSVILKCNNMHRTYTVNVKPYLIEGDNVLRVLLESPIRKGLALYDSLDYILPVSANDQAETGEVSGGKRVNVHTRKAAYHYGWDWGPRLVTSGIWRPITLRSWDDFRVNALSLTQQMNGDVALVMANIKIESSIDNAHGLLEISLNNQIIFESKHLLVKGLQQVNVPIKIDRPQLWWPNGMGKQNLYELKISLQRKENRSTITVSYTHLTLPTKA